MNWKKMFVVMRREYLERVRTKAFWIGTLLIPALFGLFIVVQIAVTSRATGVRNVAVLDLTGHFFEPLARELADQEAKLQTPNAGRSIHWVLENRPVTGALATTKKALEKEILAKTIHGFLILDPAQLKKDQVEYYSATVSEMVAISQLERALNRIGLRDRIAQRGLPAELASELEKRIELKGFKVTEAGTSEEKGAGLIAALVLFFLMYITLLMYGNQVMRGVLEEKSNRIVEVIVASVRPTELMLGKIFGVGLVGLSQYCVWTLLGITLSLPAVATGMASSEMGMPRIPASMVGFFILFFILGYFLYASIYTAIAAPFNTDQEASHLAMIPMILILSAMAIYPAVMNDPSGGMVVFFSLLPFTAPMIMFLRTSVSDPPAWQVGLSILFVLVATGGLAWFAGRIYRVGIFMYGKKPTIPEILRWARYSPGRSV